MRKLILKMSMSVDGFVAGAQGEIDWLFPTSDQRATAWTVAAISDASLHIMGSKTIHDMVAWWPYSDDVFAPPMNDIAKAVFTQRGAASLARSETTQAINDATAARKADGGNAKTADPSVLKGRAEAYVATGPIAQEIAALKQQEGGPILAHGGAGFARSLIATGMIDEFRILVHPIALGCGLSIFSDLPKPQPLRLVSTTAFPGGARSKKDRGGHGGGQGAACDLLSLRSASGGSRSFMSRWPRFWRSRPAAAGCVGR